ncbi:MAG TPA: ABC transporter ATP-binding protein [Limnochordales bacterium]
MSLLRFDSVKKQFMGRTVLADITFTVEPGEIVGLIGPNGAGKTTMLNIMTGYLPLDGGAVYFQNRRIDNLRPFQISRLGIRRTFQLSKNFPRLSVLDNCLVASEAAGIPRAQALARAEEILSDLTLLRLADTPAAELSGGQQKLLEFASCFMTDPQLICLDEPFSAVHPDIKQIIFNYIKKRHAQGTTFLVIDHDVAIMKELCLRLVASSAGRIIADGPTQAVLKDPKVIDAYLVSEV